METIDCFVKLKEIEKCDFGFFGNECKYLLEVYSPSKIFIGIAQVNIVQQGCDYSSAFDMIFDYDVLDDDDRQMLADILGVDTVEEDWLDEDGAIDIDKLPGIVSESICSNYDEQLIEYYYEEFAENADDDGFMKMDDFGDNYTFGEIGHFMEMDTDLPLEQMFDGLGGNSWYEENEFEPADLAKFAIDPSSQQGKKTFNELMSIVADEFADLDLISGCVELGYYGDYEKVSEAEKHMQQCYCCIAEQILNTQFPRLQLTDRLSWIEETSVLTNKAAKEAMCVYSDNDSSMFYDLAVKVFDFLRQLVLIPKKNT